MLALMSHAVQLEVASESRGMQHQWTLSCFNTSTSPEDNSMALRRLSLMINCFPSFGQKRCLNMAALTRVIFGALRGRVWTTQL